MVLPALAARCSVNELRLEHIAWCRRNIVGRYEYKIVDKDYEGVFF